MIPKTVRLQNLPSHHPTVLRGNNHLKGSVFMTAQRKQLLLKKYDHPYSVVHKNTVICLFLRKENPEEWVNMIKLVFGRVLFMRKLLQNNKPLHIWIWPTPWKKSVPENNVFSENDINSGSTSLFLSGPDSTKNGEICLWRKEEILKVLVHEIIHAFRIDKNDPSPKEAYVELRAVYANIYLELLERGISLSEYPNLVEKERQFGRRQCKKISRYDPGKTNIKAYLNDRNRLLNKVDKKTWERLLKQTTPTPGKKLKFTNTEALLKKRRDRQDYSGNVLNIP
jgi:hypothetical protein